MKKSTGVYTIACRENGKMYIGSAENLTVRKTQHFSELNRFEHYNRELQDDYMRFGKEAFEFKVLVYCEVKKLMETEQQYIDMHYGENCYNDAKIAQRYTHDKEKALDNKLEKEIEELEIAIFEKKRQERYNRYDDSMIVEKYDEYELDDLKDYEFFDEENYKKLA